MPTLKEVLDDKAGYADNIAFTLASGVQTTLGQLRTMRTEDQSAISKREEALASQTALITTQQEELRRAQVNTAAAFSLITEATEQITAGNYNHPSVKKLMGDKTITLPNNNGNNNNDPFAALSRMESDALMGPVVAVLRQVDSDNKKAQRAVADNLEVQKQMATNYLNGVLEDRYDRLIPADKQEKFPLDTLIRKAVENKQFRSDSTPDIRAAFRSLTAGDDAAARETQIRADERKKVTDELQSGGRGSGEIFTPAPNSFGLDVHNRSGKAVTPYKSLDDAFAAAAKDKDIWAAVDGVVQ